MLADPGGYVPLLALARHWAAAARVPPEMVLRRLCDWAMVGAFRAGAFVTRRGDPVDPFDMFVSCRAADEGLGGGVSLGHYKQYGNLQGPELLAGVIVSIQDLVRSRPSRWCRFLVKRKC